VIVVYHRLGLGTDILAWRREHLVTETQIAAMTEAHWPAVSAIYREGILSNHATFESSPPACWTDWCASKLSDCSLVARAGGQVVGWAALSPFSKRHCYAGVAEDSLYVSEGWHGQGIGGTLLGALIDRSEARGIWMLQTRIFPENQASIHLHAKLGFRQVGIREKLAKMDYGPYQGQWRDVILMERRSKVIGV
jgi:phosphinothricin acetyltransferase